MRIVAEHKRRQFNVLFSRRRYHLAELFCAFRASAFHALRNLEEGLPRYMPSDENLIVRRRSVRHGCHGTVPRYGGSRVNFVPGRTRRCPEGTKRKDLVRLHSKLSDCARYCFSNPRIGSRPSSHCVHVTANDSQQSWQRR